PSQTHTTTDILSAVHHPVMMMTTTMTMTTMTMTTMTKNKKRIAGKFPANLFCCLFQNNPLELPSASTSIWTAEGTFGSPGIVMISPVNATAHSTPSVA